MGKPTGFLDYERKNNDAIKPIVRIKNYNEFHVPLSMETRQAQAARCMDCGVPFCQYGKVINGMVSGCPLHNLVPEWNDLLYSGNYEEAYDRLLKTNNFPEFTGRVCPALCEAACTCSLYGEAVTVRANENAIIEFAYENGFVKPEPPTQRTGKKVAVIGSGPSGLAAADQLNKRGHLVTVFERSDRLGGLLMYGIPNMKLEKDIVERKIEMLKQEGITFVTGADVGKSYKSSKIIKEFDRVILACGSSNPRDISVPGRELKGIYFAVDYLKFTTKSLLDSKLSEISVNVSVKSAGIAVSYITAKDKNVLVIGGGDTGNDCVGTAIRQGCKSVLQLEMMPKLPDTRASDNPWPQWPKVSKIDYGQEEAIAVFGKDPRVYQSTIKEFISDNEGNLCKAKVVKLEFVKDDKTNASKMMEVVGSEYIIDVDIVLIAAGFLGSESYVTKAFDVEVDSRSNVATKQGGYKTNKNNIFVTGDMHRGQSLVVWAIKEGREAAREVDESLMGYTNLP